MSRRSVSFAYPSDWLVPVHPAHAAAREDTERWLKGLGLLATPESARVFQAMNVGFYGGSPFATAPFEELCTITRFLTLWIFHDEVMEGLGADAPAILEEAVRGEPASRADVGPYVRGWRELGRGFRARMSSAWLSRFGARFAEWLSSVDAEAGLAERAAAGQAPSLDEYMAVREVNIGVLPTACWLEYALGDELDDAAMADPDLSLALRMACRIVTFQNDAIGLDKDAERGWPNAVLSVAAERGCSLSAALGEIEAMHDRSVAELGGACERLSRRHGDPVSRWARDLCRMVAGFARWHLTTPRYAATAAGAEPVLVRLAA